MDLGRGRGDPLQGGGVRVDARGGPAPAGVGRSAGTRAGATRPARSATSSGCCSSEVPAVCLFVRAENAPAIRALRDGRDGARPRLPERALLRRLLLVRHGHARSNLGDHVSSVPPGEGLSEQGASEALALRAALASEAVDLGVATPLLRTQETLELALGERQIERVVLPALRRDRLRRVRGRAARRVPRVGVEPPAGRGVPGRRREPDGGGDAYRRRARRAARPARGGAPGRRRTPFRSGTSSMPRTGASRPRASPPCRTPTRSPSRRTRCGWQRRRFGRGPSPRASPTSSSRHHSVMELGERVEAYIRANGLIEPGGEVTCLVSGGADSTCLWHLLRGLGYDVRAVHVHHGLRGAEADADAAHCADAFGAEIVRRRAGCDRGRAPRASLLRDRRPRPARNGAHGHRPGRDRSLPARLERLDAGDPVRSGPTASCGRCWASGARRPRRTAARTACRGASTRRTPTRSAA